ncbi:hypothetical protein C7271_14455 [filamentous cyanobacterium CCP5]|nr:hypothetical protein C7271_14455 [filamentous cyanobacterium CCP5]
MNTSINALWLTVSPHLKRFDQRLMGALAEKRALRCWEYQQTVDEPCCLDPAVTLLHDYLKQEPQPMHLLGHGVSGLVGLMYARRFPHRVRSLTLLSVAASLSHTWHAHYYAMRELLPCSRSMVLAQMARLMFGPQRPGRAKALVGVLARDLDTSLTLHSLARRSRLANGDVRPPLLVGYGGYDTLIDPQTQQDWLTWMKPTDELWSCQGGRHFFQYEYPQATAEQIVAFWHRTEQRNQLVAATARSEQRYSHPQGSQLLD